MRYSLVSGFRGALVGAFLGESLATRDRKEYQKRYFCSEMAILGTQSLIAIAKLDLDDWRKRNQEIFSVDTNFDISSQVIIGTLPVALFFHDNKIKLRQNLLNTVEIWQYTPQIRDGTLAVAYAIAQSLTQQLNPLTLIPEIVSFMGETTTSIPDILSKVNTLLEQGAGLERVQTELSREEPHSRAIAIAFYCFLSTLEDFRLSILRAAQSGGPEATTAITGSLSGAYNSMVGIPIRCQQWLWQKNMSKWQLSNLSQMLELIDALFSTWSGTYEPTLNCSQVKGKLFPNGRNSFAKEAIAAPGVIRAIRP
ncbi:MAG: ADP-ribosylglycohydrolase family protein [Nostocaceae cyanobacterium]|nr:ADP-ribosylglycohydrolase family protein [Nostocaceae cyanobacterium]